MTQSRMYTTLSGEPLELVLYKSDSCYFCYGVVATLEALGMEIPMIDINVEPGARATLLKVGGKSQVPCLVINGVALYESNDIAEFLQQQVKVAEG